ncbi:MAG: PIN domain-containing protein [Myxococcota bacterium]|nr:PIN domain-containing protein [Myxococcota bacterium]
MSRVFVDTSAILALLVANDENHDDAVHKFDALRLEKAELVTNSYVLVETYALLGRRFGASAVRRFRNNFAPLLNVTWVDEEMHEAGLDLLADQSKRRLSLVDAVSFAQMNAQRIDRAFAFDRHFSSHGLRF